MYEIIRPLLFRIDPEKMHRLLLKTLGFYRGFPLLRACIRKYFRKNTPFSCGGLQVKNRIGLSAGFDKYAQAFDELSDFGFGFLEIGTLTPHAQPGSPRPRIFRLVKDDSLISRTGFNNPGMEEARERIKKYRRHTYTLGVNINKDPSSEGRQIVEDFKNIFLFLYDCVDYFTLNWGSIDADSFENVLETISLQRKGKKVKRSIFIKLPADISPGSIDKVFSLAERYLPEGFIATGPTQDRSALRRTPVSYLERTGAGGVSGGGIGKKSLGVIARLSELNRERGTHFILVGAGGIMDETDAEEMFCTGADLLQIYSAFIFSGPGIVRKMNALVSHS